MYITYNNKDYPCKCRVGQSIVYSGLPNDFPAPVNGEVVLKSNDGFILRTDVAESYLRQAFENGTLTLTNTPEPEPSSGTDTDAPNEPDGQEGSVTWDELAKAYSEGVNSIDE